MADVPGAQPMSQIVTSNSQTERNGVSHGREVQLEEPNLSKLSAFDSVKSVLGRTLTGTRALCLIHNPNHTVGNVS